MGKYFKDSNIRTSSINNIDVDLIVYNNIRTAAGLGTVLKNLGKSIVDLPVGLIKKIMPKPLGGMGGGALMYSSGSVFGPRAKEILDMLPNFGLVKLIDKFSTIESILSPEIRNRLFKKIELNSPIYDRVGNITGYTRQNLSVKQILEHQRENGPGTLPDGLYWKGPAQKSLFESDIQWLDDAAAKWARTKLLAAAGAVAGGTAIANLMRGGAPGIGIPASEGIIESDKYLEEINKENIPSGPSTYSQELEQDPLAKYRGK